MSGDAEHERQDPRRINEILLWAPRVASATTARLGPSVNLQPALALRESSREEAQLCCNLISPFVRPKRH